MKLFTMAIRSLLRTPGFSAVVVLALALGIGANTAIFSIVEAIFLRALPYEKPQELVNLTSTVPEQNLNNIGFSWPRLQAVMARQDVFSDMAVSAPAGFVVTGEGDPQQVQGLQVSQRFFPMLGIAPERGRTFTVDEDKPGGERVAVISRAFWEQRFASREDVVGRTLMLDGNAYTVIGVMPRRVSSFPMNNIAVWTARPNEVSYLVPTQIDNGGFFFQVLGRLKPGVSLEQARQAITTIASAYAQEFPDKVDSKSIAEVNPVLTDLVGAQAQTYGLLFAAVGCLLLIACANVANLVLARYAGRRKQIAIRFALGAKRRHVMMEFVAENVVLALAGGAVGLLLAWWSMSLVTALGANFVPRADEVALNAIAVLFALGLSVLTGVVLGLLPALQLSTPVLTDALKDSGRDSTGGRRQSRTRAALLIGEVAVSFVLLIAAGLLVASFLRMQDVRPGFNPEGVFAAGITPPASQYPDGSETLANFYKRMIERLRAVPGVQDVALGDSPPLSGNGGQSVYAVVGRAIPPLAQQQLAIRHIVSPGFFRTLGVPVVAGRDFDERDTPTSPHAIIINETMAKLAFPNEDAIGKRLITGMLQREGEVVGVVADTRTLDLTQAPQAEMFYPVLQRPENFTFMLVRTQGDPLAFAGSAREALRDVDPGLPLIQPDAMTNWVEASTANRRLTMTLLAVLAGLALVLASLGVYSVMAYAVGNRAGEIGVRMAMGARPGDVQRMVVRQGLTLTGIGVGLGVVGALALTWLMQTLLYDTSVVDPATYLGITALLSLVAVVACWVPARRAAHLDPLAALRGT